MKTLPLFLLFSLLFFSCSKDRLSASGDRITESRELENFTGVEASGSNDIHVSYGPIFQVTLKGSDNLIPYFKTEVRGGTLHLGYENVNVRHDDIQIFVTMPNLNYVSLNGSGDLDIRGNFPLQPALLVRLSGSGEVEAEDTFQVTEAVVKVSGSGEADLKKMEVSHADVQVSGSGDAHLRVLESLKARIGGSGRIYYSGSPQVDAEISGSGKVIKL